MSFEPGTLVQIKRGVHGQGNVGIVIGPVDDPRWGKGLIQVLFHDRVHNVHPSNLQKPDGRTRRRG